MDKRNTNNPFRRGNDGNQQQAKTKKESEWGKVKFNPIARNVITEQSTPWSQMKNDLIRQQQDSEHESKMTQNSNAAEILKKREETYRRNLITSKRNQPTQWEEFDDDDELAPSSSKKTKKHKQKEQIGTFDKIKSNIKDIRSMKKEDFDSKLLTKDQNNFLKKFITKNACTVKGNASLEAIVEDMKLNGVIKTERVEIPRNSNKNKRFKKKGKKNKSII
ncbi:uncharacterized protein LOC129905357 [Episyrphus balteatus]|uniref:uncharacterized protein LOC129905357 n=1 Tax=Episyrphus balteatus TaxID=286459 RepID=UPI0024866304|nr:uncharacterized protein LOC129905357 [Episyrphus balteatus]